MNEESTSAVLDPQQAQSAEEKRTSNEVADFEYVYWKQAAVTLGVIATFAVFWPVYPAWVSYKTGNRNVFRHYWRTIKHFLTYFPTFVKMGSTGRTLSYNLAWTPKQTEERLALRKGACTRCGKCCNELGCVFLAKDEQGQNICSAYNTAYWYYGTCGRYPLTQQDIDDHGCPGFSFLDEKGELVY